MTKSEEIVYRVCRKSFLSLWSYANPIREDKKELCDILIVCDPDVIIFSVKEIEYKRGKGDLIDWERWIRKAIEESCNKIYGAERRLKTTENVIRSDRQLGISIPSSDKRRIHRISIAFGGQDKVPLVYGDFGKGFIHVFDEISFDILLKELDTITDFVRYLTSKEELSSSGIKLFNVGAEEDLLALYLHEGKRFPQGSNVIAIDNTLWDSFKKKKEYVQKREEDRLSYFWDGIIEKVADDALKGRLEVGNTLSEAEKVLRTMAHEDRFSRRILGKAFQEFYLSREKRGKSRMLLAPSNIVYVFLALPHGTDRRFRATELGNRCFVARGKNLESDTVVGIATEVYEKGRGFSFDLCYLYIPKWDKNEQAHFDELQKEMKYFASSQIKIRSEDEYPKG